MKLLPVKVIGPHVTFSAIVGEDELYEETYTATDQNVVPLLDEKGEEVKNDNGDTVFCTNGSVARDATKADIQAFAAEFDPLASERDSKAVLVPKEEVDSAATYYDAVSGDKLTKKQVQDALKDAFPLEAEVAVP